MSDISFIKGKTDLNIYMYSMLLAQLNTIRLHYNEHGLVV